MRYRLRTLLIVLAVGPPLGAWGWFVFDEFRGRETNSAEWETELSLIHGSRQTIEPDDNTSALPSD